MSRTPIARRLAFLALAVGISAPLVGTAEAASGRVPQSLVGCWQRHVGALPVGTAAGVWLMRISSGGELAAFTPGTTSCSAQPDFTGTVSVTGGHLTIGPLPVCAKKAVYTWKAGATGLTLHVASGESCAARRLLFTGAWKKKT